MINIITNNHPREILSDIPVSAAEDFDYIDWSKVMNGQESLSFVKYKGEYYDLNDLEGSFTDSKGERWSYISGSFSFGWCFRYTDDCYYVVCGVYYTRLFCATDVRNLIDGKTW
jgi:hypothetical protein